MARRTVQHVQRPIASGWIQQQPRISVSLFVRYLSSEATTTPTTLSSSEATTVSHNGSTTHNINNKKHVQHTRTWASIHPDVIPYLRRCDGYWNEETGEELAENSVERYHRQDSMFHVYFLGTGAGTGDTRLSSCTLLRIGAEGMMFDAGEGAQRHVKQSIIKMKKISRIFITHMHGDHVLGLPGLLLSTNIANVFDEEDSTLKVYGPPGLYNFITSSLLLTHSKLKMNIEVYELMGGQQRIHWKQRSMERTFHQFRHDNIVRRTIPCSSNGTWIIQDLEPVTRNKDNARRNDFKITAAELNHVPYVHTFGYVVEERTPPPKIDPARAKAAGVEPGEKYTTLKNGFSVMSDDESREVHPEEVLFENPFKGRKLAILGDACGIPRPMASLCRGADVLVHEATLAEEDKEHCVRRGHSTSSMAGALAKYADASLLVLNHISGRLDSESQLPCQAAEQVVGESTRVISAFDFLEVVVDRKGFAWTKKNSTRDGDSLNNSTICKEESSPNTVNGGMLPTMGLKYHE